jgi:predicted permease
LNDTDFTVIGIGPPGFTGHEVDARTDVWLPLMMEAEVRPVFPVLNSDFFSSLHPVARLVPGVNLAQAQAEADVLAARLERPPGPRQERMRVQISPHIGLPDPDERAEVVAYLAPLSAAAALVLLIVCANVAGLLLAHMASRRHEIAVRMALGASRGRLVGRLLLEQAGLVVPGAIGGVLVSRWVTALVRVRVAQDMRFDVDAGVLGIAALVAAVAGALFGLLPALHATRVDPVRDLRAARAVGSQGSRLQSALVAGQVAVSLVLCTGAGLMVRTLQKAAAVDVGFETHDLLVVAPDLDLAGYSDVAAGAFYRRYAEAVSAIPGVRSVSWAIATPVDPGFMHGPRQVVVEGGGAPSAMPRVEVDYNEIAPRYFETLGLRVARGRDLRAADDGAAPLVAVINDAMARRDFHGVDPIGQRLRLVLFMDYSPSIEIVGVVPDIRTASLAPDIRPEVFVPLAQSVARKQRLARNAVVLIRVDPGFVSIAAVGGALGRLDPKLSFATVRTLAEQRADHLADRRLYAELLGAFGWLALLLLSIGVYGMLAFDVARQTKAIGVRVALGARRDDVVRLILWHGFKVTGAGLAAGLLGSALVTPVLASLLYGTTPADPPSVAIAVLAIVLVGLVASWLPARRASLIDPIIALRAE